MVCPKLNTYTSNNKTIAVNTGVLYIKLILSVLIGLYTSRQVLLALGIDDYGIYSVIGGLVIMMNLLGTSMIATTNRFIAVEIGKGENGNPNRIYNTLFVVHILLGLLLLLIGETLGVYYVNNYLNVDILKIEDALFVLHVSMIVTTVNVISVPAQGLIIAREKFIYTAILEILNLLLKLTFIIGLIHYGGNKLRAYSLIMAMYSLILSCGYNAYCLKNERDILKWNFNINRRDCKEIFLFSFWMLIGTLAFVGRFQGAAMIINIFFGTVLNAAFGIATQVNEYASMFVKNLTQATNPQIMKSGGAGDNERAMNLVYTISRYSFLVMLLLVVPLILNIEIVLKIWLKEPPVMTNEFIILLLINGLIVCLNAGFDARIQTTGKVRINQIGYTIINILLLPSMWIVYKMGLPPYVCVIIMIFLSLLTILFQCVVLKNLTDFQYSEYLNKTLKPTILSVIIIILPLLCIRCIITDVGVIRLAYFVLCLLWSCFCIYKFGINKYEKIIITSVVWNKIFKH